MPAHFFRQAHALAVPSLMGSVGSGPKEDQGEKKRMGEEEYYT